MNIGFGTRGRLVRLTVVDGVTTVLNESAVVLNWWENAARIVSDVSVVIPSGEIFQVPYLKTAEEIAERKEDSFFTAQVTSLEELGEAVQEFLDRCHTASVTSGWWVDPKTNTDLKAELNSNSYFGKALFGQKNDLIHTELAEATEGYRKDLMDDKLLHRKMAEVEFADALIRLGDLQGALGYSVGVAAVEKLRYNATRADHKLENRVKTGGKSF